VKKAANRLMFYLAICLFILVQHFQLMNSEILFEEVQTFSKKPVQLFYKISIGILIAAIAVILFKTNGKINSLIQLLL
jgi:hypothetical protein